MYSIKDFQKYNKPECMVITQHSRRRFIERGIKIDDICFAIEHGEIIEQYEDDFPFPSCLILSISGNHILHVVASIDNGIMYVITAYIPDPLKWEPDWKIRREEAK